MGKQAFKQTSRNVAIAWIRMTMERTTHQSAKAFRARSTNLRHYRCETGFQNRLRQPDYLSSVRMDESGRLSALRPYLTAGLPFRCV